MDSFASLIFSCAFVTLFMQGSEGNFSSKTAFCVIKGDDDVEGVINLEQRSPWRVRITGEVEGLSKGKHGFHIHEFGDLSNGCTSTGGHYNPFNNDHGAPTDPTGKRHVGDLGNIEANKDGIARVRISDRIVTLEGHFSVIGRAIVVHKDEDDLGRGGSQGSKTTGNAGARVGCCVIGLANNPPATTQVSQYASPLQEWYER